MEDGTKTVITNQSRGTVVEAEEVMVVRKADIIVTDMIVAAAVTIMDGTNTDLEIIMMTKIGITEGMTMVDMTVLIKDIIVGVKEKTTEVIVMTAPIVPIKNIVVIRFKICLFTVYNYLNVIVFIFITIMKF